MAEDDVDARTMLGLMLELRGIDVVLASDGRDALDAVLLHQPDAVVSDLTMPILDGLELCRAVRALPLCRPLPVILWSSAVAGDSRLLEAIALGGVEFLSKSLAVTEVDAALRRLLGPRQTSPGPETAGLRVAQETKRGYRSPPPPDFLAVLDSRGQQAGVVA